MIAAALKLLSGIIVVAIVAYWIAAVASYDGVKPCNPEDCDNCPFPRCEDGHINNNYKKENHHD